MSSAVKVGISETITKDTLFYIENQSKLISLNGTMIRKDRIGKGMDMISELLVNPERITNSRLLRKWIEKLFQLVKDELAGKPEETGDAYDKWQEIQGK